MKLLKRLLRGQPCSYSTRSGRGGGSGRGPLVWRTDARRRKHQLVCDECRLQERREQQYLERLRRAAVPDASDDLTARLLARTEELARAGGRPDADPPAALRPDAGPPGPPDGALFMGGRQPWGPASGRVLQRTRIAAMTAGGAAAAVALMTGSAYLLGENPVPLAAGERSTAFLQHDLGVAAASGAPDAGRAPAWSMPGEPDVAPADALSAGQLTALRAQGWACPELRDLGFHLVWARGGAVAGADVVELRLTDGRHFATVLEQHAGGPARQGAAAVQQGAAGPPVNVLTGHPAGADGFTAVRQPGALWPADNPPGTPWGDGSGGLWINSSPPFRAIVQGAAGTFTYVSDQPADEARRGLAVLVRTSAPFHPEAPEEFRGAPDEATPDGVRDRIGRGFGRILELLAP